MPFAVIGKLADPTNSHITRCRAETLRKRLIALSHSQKLPLLGEFKLNASSNNILFVRNWPFQNRGFITDDSSRSDRGSPKLLDRKDTDIEQHEGALDTEDGTKVKNFINHDKVQ